MRDGQLTVHSKPGLIFAMKWLFEFDVQSTTLMQRFINADIEMEIEEAYFGFKRSTGAQLRQHDIRHQLRSSEASSTTTPSLPSAHCKVPRRASASPPVKRNWQ